MTINTKINIGIAVGGVALVTWLVWFFGVPKEKPFQVVDARWVTKTHLRQKTLMHDAEWGEPWPSRHAFNVHCERRRHGYRDCNCTFDDDGLEDCDRCPRYDDWCEYDYYDWPIVLTKSRTGLPDNEPTYEPIEFKPPDQRLDSEVEFKVLWVDEEKKNRDYLARNNIELRQYHPRDWWSVKVNRVGIFQPIEPLKGEVDHDDLRAYDF